jgi:LPS export ABC transporter protein LptC
MIRFASLILLFAIAAAIAYLPYRQQGTKFVAQKTTLQIEMTQVSGVLLDRKISEKKIRFHSQYLLYDEAEDITTLTPYYFMGTSAGNFFNGSSQTAKLHGNQMELLQKVTLKQATNATEIRTLNTEKLMIDIQKHHVSSPGELSLSDNKQTIEADSLSGNYEEGIYEFTHHVKSHWQ